MIDDICTSCHMPRSAHLTTDRITGKPGLYCPPRADGKVAVVVGHDIVDMDAENHCAITRPRVEWRDPPRPPYIPTFAAHLAPAPASETKEDGRGALGDHASRQQAHALKGHAGDVDSCARCAPPSRAPTTTNRSNDKEQ